ncbi:hypothetical protein NBRC116495_08720 [Aurantivibrio plasticivorans]
MFLWSKLRCVIMCVHSNKLWLCVFLSLLSCASPVEDLDRAAAGFHFDAKTLTATIDAEGGEAALSLPMRIYKNSVLKEEAGNEYALIFLEGDGRPWRRVVPNKNPNTHNSVVLPLMAASTSYPAAYIHRPCYGFKKMPERCDASWWTSGRYSLRVVELLSNTIDQLQVSWGDRQLILVGHSGGGALSLLVANQRYDVAAVVTLAGNLDHSAWTDYFHYLPLSESLNAQDVTLPSSVLRWHLVAGNDKTIPASISMASVAEDPQARLLVYDDFDHNCCWDRVWPDISQQLLQRLAR